MANSTERVYVLTPTQEAMLLYSLYAPQSAAYFEQFCYSFRGNLDVPAFERAWQQLIERHSILRTSFLLNEESHPQQLVHEHVEFGITCEDWRRIDPAEHDQRLTDFLETDCARGFDIAQAPLLRVSVLRTSDDAFFIVISNHHLVLDGWSMGVVRREVSRFYSALTQGEPLELQPAAAFSDYVEWLGEQDNEDAVEFWRNELKEFSASNCLPIDRLPASLAAPDEAFDERSIDISEEVTRQLRDVARKHRLTMSTVVQGAWAILLSRYCRSDDVMFGITVSGRPFDYSEIDSLVGLLINTLPLRVRINSESNLADSLRNLQTQVARMRDHELSSLQQIHESAGISNKVPLFETLVVFENFAGNGLALDLGGEITVVASHLARTNFPLTLVVTPHAGMGLHLVYHRSRFADEAIEGLLKHLVQILESFAVNLDQPVAAVNLLSDDERQTLQTWSTSAAALTDLQLIHRIIEDQAAKRPDAIAVEHESQQITFAQLNARANQLAHYLREQFHRSRSLSADSGAKPLVGICLERSIDMIVSVLAVLKAGAAYVPVDPAYPANRLRLMLEDSGARLLLTHAALGEKFSDSPASVIALDTEANSIKKQARTNPGEQASLDDLAYVIYTSGSTGAPKGVCVQHRALASFVAGANIEYQISATDRVLQFASLSFDTSVEEIFCALAAGATLVLRTDDMITSPKQFLESCATSRITVLDLPTGYWHHLVAEIAQDNLPIPESLRLVILGGEQAKAEHVGKWQQRAGDSVRLLNTYGPTEATVVTTAFDLTRHDPNAAIPIGRPISGAAVYVLDQTLQPTPIGLPGQLYIGGTNVARDYLNKPELTSEKFIRNPFGEGRLYVSGDLVRYETDGNLEFLGRVDNQVKIRGFRIELEEIEQALLKHDSIEDAVVIAREDADGDKRLHAYLVFARPEEASTIDLRKSLKSCLPPHMIPATFNALAAMPLMPNGKIDRRALPEPNVGHSQAQVFVAPRTPIEELVAEVWCRALKLARVSVEQNFFELGGHSLLAARVFSDLQKMFAVELHLADIFKAPTVAELSELIYARQTARSQCDELMSLLAELEELSDEAAHRQLADERAAAPVV